MATTTKNREQAALVNTGAAQNLHGFLSAIKDLKNREFIPAFSGFIQGLKNRQEYSYSRLVISPTGREVLVRDTNTDKEHRMLMFASNNYLGLANHPYVKKKVRKAINRYGVGLAGPPLLNGFTLLMAELEERLAHFKQQEAAMIFPSGYSANLGMLTALNQDNDHVLYDELSHASFYDGLRMAQTPATKFRHNDLADFEEKLARLSGEVPDTLFVGIEGVYSMDGDLAPLDKILPLCKKYGAISLLDDAHGTGVLGQSGSGTAEHFGVERSVDLLMGTFSKTFAMTGGFLVGSLEMINYLRFFSRSYMFSAALPPTTLAAILAGLDLIENDPDLRIRLLDNARYAIRQLEPFGIISKPEAAIIALRVPDWMDIRKANQLIHEQGIFLNAIEYPAVPEGEERFRISITTEHSYADIDQLKAILERTWETPSIRKIAV